MRTVINTTLKITACIILTTCLSCRDDSDDLTSYAYQDIINFAKANSSLEEQFKAIWTAMNCNYAIWDYEEQKGLNWDKVYDTYLPEFQKLDKTYNRENPVPDSVLVKKYDSIFKDLHDGHLSMNLLNIHTGKKIERIISPQISRTAKNITGSLDDFVDFLFYSTFKPSLEYYDNEAQIKEVVEVDDYIYGCFKDDIVYLSFPRFNLGAQFSRKDEDEQSQSIYQLWNSWFNCIQELNADNSLKGVIIDLRNNTGGNADDYQYVLGALQEGNYGKDKQYRHIGYLRSKSGVGRYDYSWMQPYYRPVYQGEHANIKVPIILLVNKFSASMSEITCIAAKQMSNSYIIGTKTYGAFSPLINTYSATYSGSVGDPALADTVKVGTYFAPFYINIPATAFLNLDMEVVDGGGIEPDEVVHVDGSANGDNLINRALEYIRNGK